MNGSRAPIRVLHVEDEPDLAELVAEFIERANDHITVATAANASEALDRLEEADFDCVVSDYDMPGQDGLEFLRTVRAGEPDLPFILYTGKGSEDVASEAISAGVTDYLQKEVGESQYELLVNRIENAVEQRRSREKAAETEHRLQTLAENTNDILWMFTADWDELLFINSQYEPIWGRSTAELEADPRSFLQGIHPDDRAAATDHMARLSSGESVDVEFRVNADADFGRWVWVQGEPVVDDDGEVTAIVGFARDVTEWKADERVLERYRMLVETVGDPMYVLDAEGTIEMVNAAMLDALDTDEDAVVGHSIGEFVTDASFERGTQVLRELLDDPDREWATVEMTAVTAAGEHVPAETNVAVLTDGDGRLRGSVGVVRDVTERTEREAALRRQQTETAQLQALLEDALATTDTYVWDWDLRTDEVERYPSVEPIFGLTSEAIGTVFGGFTERVHPDDRERVEREIRAGIESGTDYELEFRFRTGDGPWRWLRDRAVVETADGEPIRAIGSVTDITQQRERERVLEAIAERTRDLIDATSREAVATEAVDIASDSLGAELAGVHLQSADGQRLEMVAALDDVREQFGIAPTYDRAADDPVSALIWETFERGEPRYIEETRDIDALAGATPARSGLIYPLDDHGVFIVSATEPDAFDGTDRNFIGLVARTVTAALDRVERETALRDRNRQLERLHEAGQALIRADTPEAIASQLVTAAEAILAFPITLVRYHDETAGGLVPVAMTDRIEDILGERPTFTPADDSLNWDAFVSGAPTVYDDINENDRAFDAETPIRSLMILPLGDHGTLSVGATDPGAFEPSDTYLAQLLVTTAELALARLDHEAELIRQRDELDRQNERLNQFASTLSHDLRNPLNVAQGRLELAREDCASEHLAEVERATKRMETLIEDLLSLARAGTAVGQREPVDLAELVAGCWRNVHTGTATMDVDTDTVVHADETRLQQLLENLFRNAVEHGGDGVSVTVGDLPDGFYVEDDGPGIPASEQAAVFEAGYSTTDDGTGFGLSIVKEVADAHGWAVGATDGAVGGARFEITGVEPVRR